MEMQTLEQAIDRLFGAFADLPKPSRIDGCPHCIDDKGIETLLASPLRELTADELSRYASSAFLTVGDVPDYLYFLPRILEISAIDQSWWPDPEVTGRCIRATNPAAWPAHRADALRGFNTAVIQTELESDTYDRLDAWMCAIARMGVDVRPHLAQISKYPAAILAYFEENARCLPERRLCNSFWELPCAGHEAIVEWFYSDDIRKVPFEAYGCSL